MFSLHFNVSMSLFEFVPLELTVEISVTDDPKFQDQISRLLLYGGDRLGKSPLLPQQVNLINYQQGHRLDVITSLPTSTDTVPFLRGGHDHICFSNGAHVRGHISG